MGQVWHAELRRFQRHTWGRGPRRDKLENLRGDSLLFPGTLFFPVLNIPKNFQKREISTPWSPHPFLSLCLYPTYATKYSFIRQIFIEHLFIPWEYSCQKADTFTAFL